MVTKKNQASKTARAAVLAQRKSELRRQSLFTGGIVILVLLLVGAIGYLAFQSQNKETINAETPTNAQEYAIPAGATSADRHLDIYIDFICPVCKDFETGMSKVLDTIISDRKVQVRYHPLGLLDSYSSTDYSSRAAAAAACSLPDNAFLPYMKVLYANQPAEGSAGLTNQKLVELGKQIGLNSASFEQCVTSQKYRPWIDKITDKASQDGINGTPTVLLDGKKLDLSTPAALYAQVNK